MTGITLRNIIFKVFGICLFSAHFIQAKDRLQLAEGKRFEGSLYGNMTTINNNVYLQTDIGIGINFLNYLNSTVTANIQYRNYSTVTNDFLSLSSGVVLRKNEFRVGLVGGLYTLAFSGYRDILLCGGGEIIYAYNVANGLSIRIKNRLVIYSEEKKLTFATSTFLGFCVAW